jgi:hypothetical protein
MTEHFSATIAVALLAYGEKVARAVWDNGSYLRKITFNGFSPCYVQYHADGTTTVGVTLDWDDLEARDWLLVD